MDIWDAVSALAAVIALAGGAYSWWRSNLSVTAKREAEAARDAAEQSLAATRQLAEAVERAFPKPQQFDAVVTLMQSTTYRLRNTGSMPLSNVTFVDDPPFPLPRWLSDESPTIPPGRWADFDPTFNAMPGYPPAFWKRATAKVVRIRFDESPDPLELEMPLPSKG